MNEIAPPKKTELSQPQGKSTDSLVLAAYKQMLVSLFIAASVAILFLLVLLAPFIFGDVTDMRKAPSTMLIVCLAGALGALFSALNRLYNVADLPKAVVLEDLKLSNGHIVIYSFVPIVTGVVGSAVIYLLFAAKLVEGGLFPKFICRPPENVVADADCSSFGLFIGSWSPKAAVDYAKVIVWGFIAGFAERLVPETLTALTASKLVRTTADPQADKPRKPGEAPNTNASQRKPGETSAQP